MPTTIFPTTLGRWLECRKPLSRLMHDFYHSTLKSGELVRIGTVIVKKCLTTCSTLPSIIEVCPRILFNVVVALRPPQNVVGLAVSSRLGEH